MNSAIKFRVGFHQWADSLRTSGKPIYCLYADGRLRWIGSTTKRPAIYTSFTPIVVRKYTTNRGYRIYYVYVVENSRPHLIVTFDERDDFEPSPEWAKVKIPDEYRQALIKLYETLKRENSLQSLISDEECEENE